MHRLLFGACLTCAITGSIFTGSVWAHDDNKIIVETLTKTSQSWDGETLPAYEAGQPEITMLKFTIPAKTRLKTHRHPFINAGILLKGELTVFTEDNKTLHLKAGDTIVELVNRWHYGANEGDEPAEIIIFYAGQQGMPITIIKSASD
ncbi:MAG: cupin [Gammaproteobacteria bacterium 28-57-27]|nr:MAG: cupin [Gammaproteobacteria bacterium 28-57-27]